MADITDVDINTGLVNRSDRSFLTDVVVSISSSGDNTVITGIPGKVIRVHRVALTAPSGSPVDINFKNGSTSMGTFKAVGSLVLSNDDDPSGYRPWFVLSDGNSLVLNLSSAVAVTGKISYRQQ